MNLVSGIFALMISSTVFICLFIYQFFTVGMHVELFIRDIIVFIILYSCGKFLFGYIESIFELGRKIL